MEAVRQVYFKLRGSALPGLTNPVPDAGAHYGENSSGQHQRVLVEWASANPLSPGISCNFFALTDRKCP